MADSAHHDHDHGHGHSHSHAPKVDENNRWRVGLAAILTGLFMVAEVIGGLVSGSLALLADAGHMLTDFAALAMAWGAFLIARRPANGRMTYGYDRVAILVAFVNGLTLFGVAGWIVFEAAHRFAEPGEVLAGPMLYIAIGGLVVNLVVFWILLGADQHNLNIRGAVLHVLGDLLGSVAAIAAAVIILLTGWVLADPILSVLVALLILRSAWGLVRESGHILLQGVPGGMSVEAIEADLMASVPNLEQIDDIQLWAVTPDHPVIALKAVATSDGKIETVAQDIRGRLDTRFHIEDATLEVSREA